MSTTARRQRVREIADAVMYEGYLLYPYRASSAKNQSRWQFGVLGPPHASGSSFGEPPDMSLQCLLRPRSPGARVRIQLRFLQLQRRLVERIGPHGRYESADEVQIDGLRVLSWDEAVEQALTLPDFDFSDGAEHLLEIPGGADEEELTDEAARTVGRIVRTRWPLTARVRVRSDVQDGYYRLSVAVTNECPVQAEDKDEAVRASLLGAHLLIEAEDAGFISLLEPPAEAAAPAERCRQHRCFPVLAGDPGDDDLLLGAPIILYDYPQIAEQSPGALFDATEIDEILTLRVMTMTDQEKAEACATDPLARAIIDRCDRLPPEELQNLHGMLRDPALDDATGAGHRDLRNAEPPSFDPGEAAWWDPAADAAVRPEVDAVVIDGVSVCRGSIVRVHPSRRADAQDLFFAGQLAQVNAVVGDVDGDVHVALVLLDDPAIELHEWYGRYFYFAPDELEPVAAAGEMHNREESRS
ncbi:hypothetical protein M6D93_05585 [Jatrophihabitans telluris]|uniref:Uncharacterized protein n=1 Tax=Jatrophihabitans telluris TaxID=2038343 RepID=A0ABY4R0R7_9ACTN|nr:hypothetical protein [Jatrophihabitans telluris]UQX89478.1 hypothetical protein M6D93_05585 [Jatrophihabitans telluris]